ncbi:hypothetical protein B9T24_14135 [Acinetobacter sp. ANC 4654]|uniref:hypothetical protein n=1 Tax=Acinetobacter sp. ANC 4654 TaxID=1977872 RepID=UPI000A33EB7F|nr:hypothetical protein [Acinetobacter sp. ANC 4654]OTG93605.1 hypothetical protein B9T24_14135 [Acinetobacter sp. ANC 4654]
MAVQSYPQEVWDRLKEVFETSPKLTWQQLVDLVGEELGCEMPSASVVRRKALAEKWKKRTKSLVKKSARELNNEIKKMTSQKTGQKSSQADDSKDKNSTENDVKNPSFLPASASHDRENFDNQSKLHKNKLTSATIIRKNRNRLASLGELAGDTIDSVIHIRDEVLQIDISGPITEETEWVIKNVKFKMGLISQIVELNVKQSITLTNIARSEALFWGFEQEDLKDLSEVQARRTAVVSDAERKLEEAKAKMKEGKRAAFQRKLEIIEAGEVDDDGITVIDGTDVH